MLVLLEQLGYPSTPDDVASRLEALLANPDAGVLVAESEGRLLGLAAFQVFVLLYRPRPQCRLTALVVRAGERRRGVGATLVQAVLQGARKRGCSRVELTTRPTRQDALPFYTALGFTERPHRLLRTLDED